jgi:hypothetical protein
MMFVYVYLKRMTRGTVLCHACLPRQKPMPKHTSSTQPVLGGPVRIVCDAGMYRTGVAGP